MQWLTSFTWFPCPRDSLILPSYLNLLLPFPFPGYQVAEHAPREVLRKSPFVTECHNCEKWSMIFSLHFGFLQSELHFLLHELLCACM